MWASKDMTTLSPQTTKQAIKIPCPVEELPSLQQHRGKPREVSGKSRPSTPPAKWSRLVPSLIERPELLGMSHQIDCGSGLTSCGSRNTLLWTGWLKTTEGNKTKQNNHHPETYSLTVLRDRSSKSASPAPKSSCEWAPLTLKAWGENLFFFCLFSSYSEAQLFNVLVIYHLFIKSASPLK